METADEETGKQILNKLALLEQHIINLIIPIQGINHVFKNDSALRDFMKIFKDPLQIDDRQLRVLLAEFHQNMKNFDTALEKVDIAQTFAEIKYIGNRLNNIEKQIEELKQDALKKEVKLDFSINGQRLISDQNVSSIPATDLDKDIYLKERWVSLT